MAKYEIAKTKKTLHKCIWTNIDFVCIKIHSICIEEFSKSNHTNVKKLPLFRIQNKMYMDDFFYTWCIFEFNHCLQFEHLNSKRLKNVEINSIIFFTLHYI